MSLARCGPAWHCKSSCCHRTKPFVLRQAMSRSCFICHSSNDAPECVELVAALEKRGWQCWIAPRDIPVGSSYPHEIVEGIKQCDTFLVLLTNTAATSPHILRELELALGQGKRIIPLRLPGVVLGNAMEYLLASVQWIEVTAGDLFSAPERVADRIIGGEGTRLGKTSSGNSPRLLLYGIAALAISGPIWFLTSDSWQSWLHPTEQPQPFQMPPVVKVTATPPPKAVVVQEVDVADVAGNWLCTVASAHQIEWEMVLTSEAGRISGTGPKSKVNGVKANSTERKTTLNLDGQLQRTTWSGSFVEDAKSKQFKGSFEVEFTKDFRSFSGTLKDSQGNKSANFTGVMN